MVKGVIEVVEGISKNYLMHHTASSESCLTFISEFTSKYDCHQQDSALSCFESVFALESRATPTVS